LKKLLKLLAALFKEKKDLKAVAFKEKKNALKLFCFFEFLKYGSSIIWKSRSELGRFF